eukprot:GHVR01179771.1.p1 GENE.GHVR01179771.1~~GHVR01179771.1.p1  ORF type:complete len:144 (-),score=34.73 GHVR01179771.1:128-559(-)
MILRNRNNEGTIEMIKIESIIRMIRESIRGNMKHTNKKNVDEHTKYNSRKNLKERKEKSKGYIPSDDKKVKGGNGKNIEKDKEPKNKHDDNIKKIEKDIKRPKENKDIKDMKDIKENPFNPSIKTRNVSMDIRKEEQRTENRK